MIQFHLYIITTELTKDMPWAAYIQAHDADADGLLLLLLYSLYLLYDYYAACTIHREREQKDRIAAH